METAYVLVQCKIAHEMEVLKALLEIAIARPPLEQSCAHFTRFFEIKDNTEFMFFCDSEKSTFGAVPPMKLCIYS